MLKIPHTPKGSDPSHWRFQGGGPSQGDTPHGQHDATKHHPSVRQGHNGTGQGPWGKVDPLGFHFGSQGGSVPVTDQISKEPMVPPTVQLGDHNMGQEPTKDSLHGKSQDSGRRDPPQQQAKWPQALFPSVKGKSYPAKHSFRNTPGSMKEAGEVRDLCHRGIGVCRGAIQLVFGHMLGSGVVLIPGSTATSALLAPEALDTINHLLL